MKTYTKPTSANTNLLSKSSSFGSGFMSAFGGVQTNNSEKIVANAKSVKVTK